MTSQRIRPSLADLADLDLDAPAFPELQQGAPPAVTVSRIRPPSVLSTSLPPPVPIVQPEASPARAPAPTASKPKSRFALEREKQQAAVQAAPSYRSERFEIDLDAEHGERDEGDRGALPRANPRPSLVKDVLERPAVRTRSPMPPTALDAARLTSSSTRATGFPPVGKGVFPRKFTPQPSSTLPTRTAAPPRPSFDAEEYTTGTSVDGLLDSVSKENEGVLRGMSEAEILEEQRQVMEDLGLSDGVLKMLKERAEKRARGEPSRSTVDANRGSGTTPRSKRAPAPVRPAPQTRSMPEPLEDEEEGSPEYIRRHFFPNEPANPALDWMRPPAKSKADDPAPVPTLARLAFDLQGRLVENSDLAVAPQAESSEHHVSSASTFTIPSLLSLTASSVPSQRSTAFATLTRVLAHPSDHSTRFGPTEWTNLRYTCLEKASWALRDPTRSVVLSAVDLVSHLFSSELASPRRPAPALLPNAEEPKTFLSTFGSTDPLPPIAVQLSIGGGTLPRSSLVKLVEVLVAFVRLAGPTTTTASRELDALVATPRLVESVVERFVATTWPPLPGSTSSPGGQNDLPCPIALELLALVSRSSRTRAKDLCTSRNVVDSTLRYLAVPPWELDASSARLGRDMFDRTIELWTVLARYGLGCGTRTQAAPLLEGVIDRISEVCRAEGRERDQDRGEGTRRAEKGAGWFEKVLELLTIWTTAAVDPHVTSHDIVWSQVVGWKDVAVEVHEWSEREADKGASAAAWALLASWLEGSKVNAGWRGEEQREWVKDRFEAEFGPGGTARRRVDDALKALTNGTSDDRDAQLVVAALSLSNAYEDSSNPPTPKLFLLDETLARDVIDAVVSLPPTSATTQLLVSLLPHVEESRRLSKIVNVLPLLRAEDAVAARDLIDQLVSRIVAAGSTARAGLDADLEVPSLALIPLLRPFFTHAIVTSSGGRVVGPSIPTPRDIKLTASLAPFAPVEPLLKPDWPLVALDELLRSAASPVFQNPPPNWDATELQLVQASLILMRVVVEMDPVQRVSAAQLVFDVIKIFMLEKNDGAESVPKDAIAETDLFRNPTVQHSLSRLVEPLSIASQGGGQVIRLDERTPAETIEGVSARVSTAPFYQLYTDLVGLYDSISLSDRVFGLVLLPPLAMAHPVDYRRLVWTDYAHILRTLTFSVADAISDVEDRSGSLSSYLYPIETNETMLKAYVDALSTGTVQLAQSPFLAFVAIHHVAEAILGPDSGAISSQTKSRLVKTLVGQAEASVLKQILDYRQARAGEVARVPPECFEGDDEGRLRRVERLVELGGGEEARVKLDKLV
ncbi:hypothetical protein JCM10212_004118 [Sporobolomyces blumeae]